MSEEKQFRWFRDNNKEKSQKKVTIFLLEPENSKKLNIFSDCSEFVNLNV